MQAFGRRRTHDGPYMLQISKLSFCFFTCTRLLLLCRLESGTGHARRAIQSLLPGYEFLLLSTRRLVLQGLRLQPPSMSGTGRPFHNLAVDQADGSVRQWPQTSANDL